MYCGKKTRYKEMEERLREKERERYEDLYSFIQFGLPNFCNTGKYKSLMFNVCIFKTFFLFGKKKLKTVRSIKKIKEFTI